MSSTKNSKHPPGCISIPIEVLSSATKPNSSSPRFPSNFSYSPPRQSPTKASLRRPLLHHHGLRSTSDFIHSFVPQSDFLVDRFPSTAHDRSHSPGSQRDESPNRTHPTSPQQSDSKKSKEATGSDQQVPSPEIPLRDPNQLALEKLEQLQRNLLELNEQVDAFAGSTRDDRTYRVLDEQAVKMMLRCDELIDVSADIKEKRKEMIQHVQTVVAKLESKVPINPSMELNSNEDETALTSSPDVQAT